MTVVLERVPPNRAALSRLIKRGEGVTLELKRSTAELHEAMHTVCAFLNGASGLLLFGIRRTAGSKDRT